MAKKLQKSKKGMSPRAKSVLVNSFKGIISNQSCVDNGKEAPWWLAILFLLFSVLIPLIPNHVHMNNAYGSSFLTSGAFGLDTGLAKATVQLRADDKGFDFVEGLLTYEDLSTGTPIPATEDPIYSDTRITANGTQYNFLMYYTDKTGSDLSNFVNLLTEQQFIIDTTNKYDPTTDPEGTIVRYTPNFLVLTPYTLACAIYKANSTTRAGNTYGGLDWSNTPKDQELLSRLTDGVVSSTAAEIATKPAEIAKVYNGWRSIFNETYLNQKNKAKWQTTLIYLGVYAGLMVFLGLMIFLLTRGRNNPFRSLNFWICQKIAYFLGFTPAVLALILGFIFSANIIGQMAFIMLVSLRVMWASMRQLRPVM